MRFEYTTKILVRAEFIPTLNEMGALGWELVGLIPTAMIVDGQVGTDNKVLVECVFKRATDQIEGMPIKVRRIENSNPPVENYYQNNDYKNIFACTPDCIVGCNGYKLGYHMKKSQNR